MKTRSRTRWQILQVALNPINLILLLTLPMLVMDFSWAGFTLWMVAFANWGALSLLYAAGLAGYNAPFTRHLTAERARAMLADNPAALGLTDPDEIAVLTEYLTPQPNRYSTGREKALRSMSPWDVSDAIASRINPYSGEDSHELTKADRSWARHNHEIHDRYSPVALALVDKGWLKVNRHYAKESSIRAESRNLDVDFAHLRAAMKAAKLTTAATPATSPSDMRATFARVKAEAAEMRAARLMIEEAVQDARSPYEEDIARCKERLAVLRAAAEQAEAEARERAGQIPDASEHERWLSTVEAVHYLREKSLAGLASYDYDMDGRSWMLTSIELDGDPKLDLTDEQRQLIGVLVTEKKVGLPLRRRSFFEATAYTNRENMRASVQGDDPADALDQAYARLLSLLMTRGEQLAGYEDAEREPADLA
jgi:hypothetical protein